MRMKTMRFLWLLQWLTTLLSNLHFKHILFSTILSSPFIFILVHRTCPNLDLTAKEIVSWHLSYYQNLTKWIPGESAIFLVNTWKSWLGPDQLCVVRTQGSFTTCQRFKSEIVSFWSCGVLHMELIVLCSARTSFLPSLIGRGRRGGEERRGRDCLCRTSRKSRSLSDMSRGRPVVLRPRLHQHH